MNSMIISYKKAKKAIQKNACLLLIILVGLGIRIFGIKEVGINDYDTAYYANLAKVPIFTSDWFFSTDNEDRTLESLKQYLINRGCGVSIVKPGHIFLIFISFLIFGVTDYAILLNSIFSSIGVIILTYLIGKKLFNKQIALMGSALITVSSQNIIYARTGYPQADTTLLFCIFFFFVYQHLISIQRSKYFWYSSIIAGILFLFHQSAIIALMPLIVVMLFDFMIFKNKKKMDCVADCIFFISISSSIIFLANFLINLINSLNPIEAQALSDRLLLTTVYRALGYFGVSIEKIIFYPRMFWILEGPLVTLLIIISLIYIAWKAYEIRSINLVTISLVTIFPLLFWIVNYTTLKGIQVLMPFISICVGVFVFDCVQSINKRKINAHLRNKSINVAIALILSLGILNSFPKISSKNNYNSVFSGIEDYMDKNGGRLNASQNNIWPIVFFYAGNIVDKQPSKFKDNFIFDRPNAQSDYKIIDWNQFIPGKNDISSLISISELYIPIIQNEYRYKSIPIHTYHRHYDLERVPNIFKDYPQSHFISVYDLRKRRVFD